ncbi:zinc-dependent alcohol dehydrogenase family protein [Microlunatus panaciterrae]|uniref:Alcohol dehydrogenase n=1 Tax=Microlunatus panaciterrae TaxID=400768 RepID=A0ABS2REI9_9ACTN|nr:zinc-dependent alcohol dehydrogenase family protein [Microlunatus panaciterrae]MBM7797420.1 alcohol dehydrogenase [Microlunatus panaciterrae]
MRAVVFSAVHGPLELVEVDDPQCPPTGAVIRVRATGVCRSDWHAWRGHDPVSLPHTPGHELAGVVHQVGPEVRRWSVGDRVTVPFVCGCGCCEWCRSGESQVCPQQTQPGFTHPGSFAELVVIHHADHNLVGLPAQIDFVAAASLGCRFATAFRALTVHGELTSGQWLAVYGCGGVGLSAVMIAEALGARVVAVDVDTRALDRARELGADAVLDASALDGPEQVAERVRDLTSGGAHVSMDALGSEQTAVGSVLSLRRRGRHLQVGLLLGQGARPPLPMDRVVALELSVHGSHGMAAREYPALLDLITSGRLNPRRLVGRTVGLDRAGAELAAFDQGSPGGLTVVVI